MKTWFMKRKTTDEFKKEIENLVGNEYSLLSEYINCHTKVKMLHLKCNNVYWVKPNDFQQGYRCPHCYGRQKRTNKEFRDEVFSLVGNEYSVLSEYINNSTKIKLKHNICGNIYETTPQIFLTGCRCPHCYGGIRKTTSDFKNKVLELVGNEYSVLSEYINSKTKIKMKHNKCGNEYKVKPETFIQGRRCPYCYGTPKKTTEVFKKEIFDLVGNEYSLLTEYINCKTKIKMKHNKCGNIYEVKPNIFLNGRRCPYCKSSKGEDKIRKYLETNNIYFQEQYSFPDCKYKRPLKFDFYLEDDSGKIILIEYDGEQHFKECYYVENLTVQQNRDKIKDDYCNNHDNIDLYRISYKEFNNIETILNDIIDKYE